MLNFLLDRLNRKTKQAIVIFNDFVIFIITIWISFSIRYDELYFFKESDLIIILFCLIIFYSSTFFFGIYNQLFRYASYSAALQVTYAVIVYGFLSFILLSANQEFFGWNGPRSVSIIHSTLIIIFIVLSRYVISEILKKNNNKNNSKKNLAIYGISQTAIQIARSAQLDENYFVVCFVDEDQNNIGKRIFNIPVISIKSLKNEVSNFKIDEIIVSRPNETIESKKNIYESFEDLKVNIKFFGSLTAHLKSSSLENFQKLAIENIFNKKDYSKNLSEKVFFDKTILVTGAGGSIGSELCKQILNLNPKRIIALDHSEINLYSILNELQTIKLFKKLNTEIVDVLATVKDNNRIDKVFHKYKPNYIYHTAAYKHVPMMETNIIEAISNNILGTLNVARSSIKYHAEKFIFVSTDKAVRPTNIMGASKRAAELYIQDMSDADHKTTFAIVRFGNVFGSSGSVVPLFYSQIIDGGPITLTHKDTTRFLMSIAQAATLILNASNYSTGGEVFVLDMGKPIKIYELAKKMIQLTGYSIKDENNPNGDIEIKITGLRKGEKLHEELLIGNKYEKLENEGIIVAFEEKADQKLLENINIMLSDSIKNSDEKKALSALRELVNDYQLNN